MRIAQGSGHHPLEVVELLDQFKLMATTMQRTMKKNKKMGKAGADLHNMDAATVAQMMHKMNPQVRGALGSLPQPREQRPVNFAASSQSCYI